MCVVRICKAFKLEIEKIVHCKIKFKRIFWNSYDADHSFLLLVTTIRASNVLHNNKVKIELGSDLCQAEED